MKNISSIFLLLLLILISCDNPFLPPVPDTNRPLEAVDYRKSPNGIILQLIKAYEYKNIGIYASLITGDFRFYVASGFDKTEMKYKGQLNSEKPDTFMTYVTTSSTYYYWDSTAEVTSTRNMFSKVTSIEVDQYQISAPKYTNDTLAEVMVKDLLLDITMDIGFEYKIENKPQVFLLRRTKSKNWLIWKWYDLGSEG